MTSLIEKIITVIAPHRCVCCGNFDNFVCASCLATDAVFEESVCVMCAKPTTQWRICQACSRTAPLLFVRPYATYSGVVETAIKAFKYGHVRSLAEPLAGALVGALPYLSPEWVVVPVPTAPARVRQRGYDQSVLLAKAIARECRLTYAPLLRRAHDARQVGSDRSTRLRQAQALFAAKKSAATTSRVLLIDDVCTTGSTLAVAAKVLRKAGVQEVAAAVVAWQPPVR